MSSPLAEEIRSPAGLREFEAAMNRYEIVFESGPDAPEHVPQAGETVEIGGELWEVESVDDEGLEPPRVHLIQPNGDGKAADSNGTAESDEDDVEAHMRFPVKLAAPTSFEEELVYTLNDLSTRLSTLAKVLTAYWGKGAA